MSQVGAMEPGTTSRQVSRGSWTTATFRLAVTLGLTSLLVACGSSTSPSSLAPKATVASPGTPSPTAQSASTEPSASATGAGAWIKQTVAEPPLQLEVPAGYQALPAAALEAQFKQQLPKLTGDVAAAFQYEIDLIDSGQLRSIFGGPSAVQPFIATIQFIVLTNADDLAAAVTRQRQIEGRVLGATQKRAETNVVLPIGQAVRVLIETEPSGGSPSQDIDYIVRLDATTTLIMTGTAPQSDKAFALVMFHAAQSLARD